MEDNERDESDGGKGDVPAVTKGTEERHLRPHGLVGGPRNALAKPMGGKRRMGQLD